MDYDTLYGAVMQPKYHIHLSANGVEMQSVHRVTYIPVNPAKRGKIRGFSAASARRMRHFLYKPDYSNCCAVTLTRPLFGDMCGCASPEEAFDMLCKHQKRLPFLKSLIWRKEVQRNGTSHFHCILFPSKDYDARESGESLVQAWIDALFSKPCPLPEEFKEIRDREYKKTFKAHHDKRRPSVRVFYESGGYVRYMLDHQSKHKDYQSKTVGRVWGVWNRSGLPLAKGVTSDITEREWWALGRVLRKATRYRLQDSGKPFGYVHSHGRSLSSHGDTVYFGRTLTGRLASDIKRYLEMIRKT